MNPDKEYVIHLNPFDLGQLLDGLEARTHAWRNTATYLTTGEAPTEDFIAEECTDAEEAERLADHYDQILETLLTQKAIQDQEQ